MKKTVFDIPKMDCASEERLVRMALEQGNVAHLDSDLGLRRVTVMHEGEAERLLKLLAPLNFGARITKTGEVSRSDAQGADAAGGASERGTLRRLLAINGAMFLVEIIIGWIAQSTGLIADSLDMFADAAVYGVALYAVGKAASLQTRAARLSGYLQFALAMGALFEVVRRFYVGSEPEPTYMIGIALLALIANISCMVLIAKHRKSAVYMRASWIFSTNDVIANLGVILAGILVAWTGSHLPDLVIGLIIALIVLSGALRIIRMGKTEPD